MTLESAQKTAKHTAIGATIGLLGSAGIATYQAIKNKSLSGFKTVLSKIKPGVMAGGILGLGSGLVSSVRVPEGKKIVSKEEVQIA